MRRKFNYKKAGLTFLTIIIEFILVYCVTTINALVITKLDVSMTVKYILLISSIIFVNGTIVYGACKTMLYIANEM